MSTYDSYDVPDIVYFARQVIDMHHKIIELEAKCEHYKEMYESACNEIDKNTQSTYKNIGTIISAVIDPESAINKGHRALIKEQLKQNEHMI